jgi:hypothetical protein
MLTRFTDIADLRISEPLNKPTRGKSTFLRSWKVHQGPCLKASSTPIFQGVTPLLRPLSEIPKSDELKALQEDSISLWVEEVKDVFFLALAEGSANAHVADDGAGYARRKALRRIVAARAVLLEYALAVILGLSLLLLSGRAFRGCICLRIVQCYGQRKGRGRGEQEGCDHEAHRFHGYFPFQAGNRKR